MKYKTDKTRQDLSLNWDLVRLTYFLFVPPLPLVKKFCLLFTQTPRSLSPHKWGWFLPDKKYIQTKWKMENAYESSEGKIIPRVAIVSSLLGILIPECSVNIMFRWMINLQREIIWAVKPSYIWSTSTVAQCPYDMTIMGFQWWGSQFYVNFKDILDYNLILWTNIKSDTVILPIFICLQRPVEGIVPRETQKHFCLLKSSHCCRG